MMSLGGLLPSIDNYGNILSNNDDESLMGWLYTYQRHSNSNNNSNNNNNNSSNSDGIGKNHHAMTRFSPAGTTTTYVSPNADRGGEEEEINGIMVRGIFIPTA